MSVAVDYKRKRLVEKDLKKVYRFYANPNHRFNSNEDANLVSRSMIKQHLSGVFAKRKTDAMLFYLDKLKWEFRSAWSSDLETRFIQNELYPVNDYNLLDCCFTLRTGAALWMLDELKTAGKLDDVMKLFPVMIRDKKVFLPEKFYHPCYSNDLIESMIFALSVRYVKEHTKKTRLDEFYRYVIVSQGNAKNEPVNDFFQSILDLLPEDRIKCVCDEFREKVWDLACRFLKGQNYLQAQYDGYCDTVLQDLKSDVEEPCASNGSFSLVVGPVANPSESFMKNVASPLSGCSPANSMSPLLNSGFYIGNEKRNAFDSGFASQVLEKRKRLDDVNSFILLFDYYLVMDRDTLLKNTGSEEMTDIMSGFSVDDPYGMCFALVYLLDHGDDAPWLARSGGSLMRYVLNSFPFVAMSREDKKQFDEGIYDKDLYTEGKRLDLYGRYYDGMNLAQILYRLSGSGVVSSSVLPSALNPEHPLLKSVDPSLYPVIGSLSGLLSFVKDFCGIPDEDDSDDADDDEGNEDDGTEDDLPQEEDAEPDDVELLSLKLAKAKEEIKNLKHVLAETRRKNQDVLADKNKQLKALQREHTELVDLRELVFNQESLEQVPADDTKPVQDITFPYETKKRVVVFGGHDTFLKVIKPMFPTVRFVDTRNIAFNPDIVRNADVVWIQNNCISHSQFWTVIKLANLYGVQVRYFASAGTDRCARQIVEEDIRE